MNAGTGRFTEAAMAGTMRHIAARLGASPADARLLGLTNNAVYALPRAGLVIRITRSHLLKHRAFKIAQLARWFAAGDAPTIRLAGATVQPIAAHGTRATVWAYVAPAATASTVADLGTVLREFHALGLPPFPLRPWDPVGDARTRLADAEALGDDDRDFLTDWCDRLEPRLLALRESTRPGLVHGDAHLGNLLRSPGGRPLLCDFDATCAGPPEVDLVAVPVGEIRFGRAGTHRAMAAAYGHDVTRDPHWPLLREARELKMTVAAVPLLASGPGIREEFLRRIDSVRRADTTARWTPYGNLRRAAAPAAIRQRPA